MRRIGEAKRLGVQYRMRPGAYGIAIRNGKVLLIEETRSDENLQLPGGGIDLGESPIVALHREMMEETGWRVAQPVRIGAFRRFPFMPEYGFWAEKVCHIFLVTPTLRIGEPTEPGHIVHWLDPEDALDGLGVDGYRFYLANALRLFGLR